MPVAVPGAMAGADVLCCLGLGLAVAVLYDAAAFVLGRARPVLFVLDVLSFALAGVLAYSYAAARSYAGLPRWYHLVGMAGGVWAYYGAVAPLTRKLEKAVYRLLALPFRLALRWVILPAAGAVRRRMKKKSEKKAKNQKKRHGNNAKQLQSTPQMLYNSN